MALFDKKEEKVHIEEKLNQLMKTQLEDKANKQPLLKSSDSRIEGFLLFKLVCSMNEGNSGVFHGRPEMAKRQLDEIQKLGYDLNQIYNSFYDISK